MEPILLDTIPFELDVPAIVKRLRLEGDEESAAQVRTLAEQAKAVARPKAVYKVCFVDSRGEDSVVIDGVSFASRVMRVNLETPHRVFPFVATCGVELEKWAAGIGDMLQNYWAGAIMEAALRAAIGRSGGHLAEHHNPGKTSTMNPGSLKDWPVSEQPRLFSLIGDVTGMIGVRLTETFLMLPIKSVSGLRFPAEIAYENCQLCPREVCPGRRAPFDKALYETKYKLKA